MRLVSPRLFALAAFSALLQLLPFPLAGPVPFWRRFVCWFCLVPLLRALLGHKKDGGPLSPLQSAALAYLCGVLWFGGNCYWIYQTMFLYGGLPAPIAFGILILFSLYLGLYFGLFGLVFALVRRWKSETAAIVCTPFLWVAVELARARITGFPWDLLGYTQVDHPFLTRLAPWTGVMGLSLLVAAGNALWLWRPAPGRLSRRWFGPACAATVMALAFAFSLSQGTAVAPTATAVLLQDNLGVGAQAGPGESQPAMLASFAALTLHPNLAASPPVPAPANGSAPQLVLWPEAPTSFLSADPQFRAAIGGVARAMQAPLIVDAVALGSQPKLPQNGSARPEEYVSASFFLPDGSFAGRYDKMHLVPFGEYTPYKQLFFFAGHLLDQLTFSAGTQRHLFSVAGHRYGVFICYESIFGDEVRAFAADGAQVLVNLTDDGWYGDTSAPWEHLDMARMRAIENDRWVLRDTNTGLTAAIDPRGRIVASLPRHVRGAAVLPFGYRNDVTFYTRHGDWIAWLCTLISVSVLLGSYLQRRFPYRDAGGSRLEAC